MKTLSVFSATLVATLSLAVRAADIAVTDGDSFALDGASNVAENRLVFPSEGDATLNLTGVAGSGETVLLAQIVSSGTGAATLATDEGAGKTLRFKNHVSVKGTLTVTGFGAVKAGDTAVTPATLDAATDLVAPFPAFDVATLGSAVTIDGAAQLPQTPAGDGTLTKAASAFLALTGEEVLGAAETYNLGCHVMIVHTNAFSKGATINVADGLTLGYCPLVVAADYSWSFSSETKIYSAFNVVLGAGLSEGAAQFHLYPDNSAAGKAQEHYITGQISGQGDVKALPMRSKGSNNSAWVDYYFRGRQSFVGTLYSNNTNVKFFMGAPEDGQVPFKLWLTNIDTITFWSTSDSADWGCDNVYLPEIKFGYYNTNIWPQNGQTVTVGKYSGGGINIYGVGADKCKFVMLTNDSPTTVLRMARVSYTVDAKTLAVNNYYDIDLDGGVERQWYRGNSVSSLATVTSAVGVGVPVGRTLYITSLSANKKCEVLEGATVHIGTVESGASVKAAASATVNITTQTAGTAVTAAGGATVSVTSLGAGASVKAGDGAAVHVLSLGGNNAVTVGRDASVSVSDPACDTLTLKTGVGTNIQLYDPEAWKKSVTLWVDASKPETLHSYTNAAGVAQDQTHGTACGAAQNYKAKAWWYDWRSTQTRYYLYNSRGYYDSSKPQDYPGFTGISWIYPWYQPEGGPKEGMGFVNFGEIDGTPKTSSSTSRLDLFDSMSTGNAYDYSQIPVAYVVMVYGADARANQLGGAGLFSERLAGDVYPMKRAVYKDYGSINDPMVADTATTVTVRKNGAAAVNASSATFDEGWQILGLNVSGHKFDGVGFGSNLTCGGQKVAEMLVFQTMPSEDDKARIEAYLSEKWGIAVSSSPSTSRPTLAPTINGSAVVNAGSCDLDLSKGAFFGTVKLANGALTLADGGASVPTIDDLPQTDKILAWFDPSKTESLAMTEIPAATVAAHPGAEQTNEVAWVWDRRGTRTNEYQLAAATGRGYLVGADRRGYLLQRQHVMGAMMPWIDELNHYAEVNSAASPTPRQWGNSYRIYKYDANGKLNTSDTSIPFATAFLVQDSTLGGGSPFLDAYTPSAAYNRATSSPTAKLWGSGVADALKNGSVYVNGTQVANPLTSAEFTGGPEVLSVKTQTDTTFPVKAIGYYSDSEGGNTRAASYGEMLFYSVELTEAERKTVEAYLAWKWNSVCLHGTMAYAGRTLDGATAYAVTDLAKLPSFAPTYTGTMTLNLTDPSLDFTVDAEGQVLSGGFNIPGTVVLPAEVTVNVASASRIRSNTSAKLLSWGALGSATTFTLNSLTGADPATRDITLRTAADGLYLDVKGKGILFLVK